MQFASTIKNRTSQHTTKVFNRACKANPSKIIFKVFPTLQKNASHKLTENETVKQ